MNSSNLEMNIDADINDEEREAIIELRKRLKDDMEPELFEDVYFLLRFLRARDFNVDNTEKMLRKHLEWRKKNDAKNILKWKKSEFMEKYCPYVSLGHCKEGYIVRYSDTGNMDVKGFFESTTFDDLQKLITYESEKDTEELKQQSKKLGRNIDKAIYIYNFENFSFASATNKKAIQCSIAILESFVNNYPERLKTAYVLNVSMYFNLILTVVKSILPQTILNKIKFYADDSYKEDLLKIIDADVLPAFLGGNRTDPDGNPLCLTFVNHGTEVPKSYYLSERKQALMNATDAQMLTLSRASFSEIKNEVKEPGSYLEWEFETKCRDIGFGLFYQDIIDDEEKITEIVPIERIDTELYPETGTFKCDTAGTYVIIFDNTYSWVRGKDIYYRVKIISPKEYESTQVKE